MAQKLLSISLGTSSAKISVVSKAGTKVSVYSCYDIQLPEGVCDDGAILDVDALAGVLKHHISMNKIKTKKLVFAIASKRIASKEVVIPFVKEKQIKSIININAPEYFPIANIEDYVLNYSIIEIVKNAENTQYRMNVTATPNEMLLGYKELASKMKCDIDTIDFAGNAILQMLKFQTQPGEICAILQLGYEHVVINIMNGPVQVMQRTVSTGLKALISAVCENVKLDEEDAAAFLEDNDITRVSSSFPDVKEVLDAMVSSISRIFDFYNGRAIDHPISHIKFLGDATYIDGLDWALERRLGYTAHEIYRLSNVDIKGKNVTNEQATNFIANIGAVINPMHISYENKSDKSGSKDGKLPIWIVVLAVVAAAVLLGSTFAMYYESQSKYDVVNSQVESLKPMRELETELEESSALVDTVSSFYEETKGPNDSIPNLVKDLEEILPKGTSIDNITIDSGEVIVTAGGNGKKSVAKLISELKSLSYVSNVHVDYVSETDDELEKYDVFTITFNVSAPNEVEIQLENDESSDITAVDEGGEQ